MSGISGFFVFVDIPEASMVVSMIKGSGKKDQWREYKGTKILRTRKINASSHVQIYHVTIMSCRKHASAALWSQTSPNRTQTLSSRSTGPTCSFKFTNSDDN